MDVRWAGRPGPAGDDSGDRLIVTATKDGAETAVSRARIRYGHVRGIVHLLPLANAPILGEEDPATYHERLTADLRVLYHLAQAAAADLATDDPGPRWVVAATALGRHPGRSAQPYFTGARGAAGFVKAVAKEWPHVRAKTIDLARDIDPGGAADLLLDELTTSDGIVEVSYGSGRRSTTVARRAALPACPDHLELGPRSVILITGGARGITSLIARDLARRYQCALVLLGRSPLPPTVEDPATARAATPAEIRTALIENLRDRGEKPVPAHIEAACQRVLHEREVRATLDEIQAVGGRVEYYQADVRDPSAIRATVEEVYARHNRLDGLVHAAGLVEDRLVVDKEPASFDRVLRTKVDGALNLLSAVRPESLRFVAFFASVAGTFGNAGQADYAAANEILNAIAADCDARVPARVVAFNWGPWDAPGMVTPEVRRQFSAQGVELLAPEHAVQAFVDELRLGRKGEVEVVIGEGPWSSGAPLTSPVDPHAATSASQPQDRNAAASRATPDGSVDRLPTTAVVTETR